MHNPPGTRHAQPFNAAKNPELKPLAPTADAKFTYLGGSAQLLPWREGDGEETTHPSSPLLDGRRCSAGLAGAREGSHRGLSQCCTKAHHDANEHHSTAPVG